ncbi:Serpentine receptor class J-38 [Caenorhabditis elegans]|uniref:Serpentine receptor class J-38 n=1 Tax=Caenorhabditis elegans TaxID=6239 RepID=SRJ38_CAEEL|nr:Serpentine receptor class J-38 [Caenorhabditis elegans]O16975.2 RecName: Full=Serpentine receptor class J-38; Short=Protein srj-38 [Caenorhabditis elegans]CCD72450.1 Serpentine receptor class J-38 [Caenorhabditis elegans]|eukprot:NP_503349.1 Serpentine receptor class J-38 [Caenorhabditis elegans]
MLDDWIYIFLPRISCALAWVVNPIFVYFIFTEKSQTFGNYRYLLLFFALFNLLYSVVNVVVPIDIHNYRYCFFLILRHGWFVEISDFHYHMAAGRCSLVASSYALLLVHFIYRFLVIYDSSLTRLHFHWYMTGSLLLSVAYFVAWQTICWFLGYASVEMRQYVREEIRRTYGRDSMDFNMIGTLYDEASYEAKFKSWLATIIWSSISVASISAYMVLALLTIHKLKKMSCNASKKTSKFQFELLRALIVQTLIPIVISFSPCLLCWYTPIFGIQLPREFNYFEVGALGLFSFVDPIAIILCLPIFRHRISNFWKTSTTSLEEPSTKVRNI